MSRIFNRTFFGNLFPEISKSCRSKAPVNMAGCTVAPNSVTTPTGSMSLGLAGEGYSVQSILPEPAPTASLEPSPNP
jgi:hypothetical protein